VGLRSGASSRGGTTLPTGGRSGSGRADRVGSFEHIPTTPSRRRFSRRPRCDSDRTRAVGGVPPLGATESSTVTPSRKSRLPGCHPLPPAAALQGLGESDLVRSPFAVTSREWAVGRRWVLEPCSGAGLGGSWGSPFRWSISGGMSRCCPRARRFAVPAVCDTRGSARAQ
jgi:hypothetical protein